MARIGPAGPGEADKLEQQTVVIVQGQEKQQQQAAKLQETTDRIAVSIETIAEDFKVLAYFKIGDEVTSMSVQITYVDGTQSPARLFQR